MKTTTPQTAATTPYPGGSRGSGRAKPSTRPLPLHLTEGKTMIETIAAAIITFAATQTETGHPSQQKNIVATAARIPETLKDWTRCVSKRESHHNYRARNKTSSAQGRYQFLDYRWRINGGIEHVVARRLTDFGLPKTTVRAIREHLSVTEIAKWDPPFQNIAFIQVVEEGGSSHWYLSGSTCNQMMPK